MAWEWVAPVASAVALTATGTFTYLTARSGAQTARAIADTNNTASAEQARDDRTYAHRADAYIQVLTVAGRMAQWAAMVRPTVTFDGDPPPPHIPDADEQNRVRALVLAHGTAETRRLYDVFQDRVRDLIKLDGEFEITRHQRQEGDRPQRLESDLWTDLENTVRPAVHEAFDKLAARIGNELA